MTDIKRDRGRPKQEISKGDNLIIRVTADMLSALDKIVNSERELTGYNISRSDIVRKAVNEFLERNKD